MTMYWVELILLIIIIVFCDIWFFKRMKKHRFYSWFINLSLLPGIFFIIIFLYIRFGFKYNHSYQFSSGLQWMFYLFSLIYIPKIIYIFFFNTNILFNKLSGKKSGVIRKIGYIIAIFLVFIMGYGNLVTRDKLELVKQEIEVKNLPKGFDGYKIAIFADFHIGNWNNHYRIMNPLIQMINKENPDIIIFAGDMVNNFSDELNGWEPYFRQLKSKQGNFAVLGNHDYGDYTNWKSSEMKEKNLEDIKKHIQNLGFRLLLNENQDIIKGTDTISMVGVENWSNGHFHCYGDLNKALKGTKINRQKIIVSHDPTHWNAEIVGKESVFLTIAGHTHGGQIGIINKYMKVSPAKLAFNEWEGLYKNKDQYLYVNRGIGYVGIPLRVGVRPEVTILILKKETHNP